MKTLAMLLALAYAGTSITKDTRGGATLKVTHPPKLVSSFNLGEVKNSLGNFGHIQYGSTILAPLHYPETNKDGCEPFEAFFDQRYIVMVDAGDCPITTKVRNIEHAGG